MTASNLDDGGHPKGCPVAPASFADVLDLKGSALDDQARYFGELRAAGPVVWVPALGAFAVTEYADIEKVLLDPVTFSTARGEPRGPRFREQITHLREELVAESPEFRALLEQLAPDWRANKVLFSADPPAHTMHRRVISRLFTPKRVKLLRPSVEAVTHALIDDLEVAPQPVDAMTQFAVQLPLRVIAQQLGITHGELDDFKRWSDDFVAPIGNDKIDRETVLSITRTSVEFAEFFLPAIERRRKEPQDDFLTLVALADDDSVELTDADRLQLIAGMLGAGNETSTKMLGEAMQLLAQRPDVAERLIADVSLIPAFVEEVLRLQSPVQGLYRMASRDTEVGGIAIPMDSYVWVLYASGNRSGAKFSEPDTIDLGRTNSADHLAFGKGIHFCAGAPLARLEGVVGVSALLDRVYPWVVESSERQPSYVLHGLQSLNLRFERKMLVVT